MAGKGGGMGRGTFQWFSGLRQARGHQEYRQKPWSSARARNRRLPRCRPAIDRANGCAPGPTRLLVLRAAPVALAQGVVPRRAGWGCCPHADVPAQVVTAADTVTVPRGV